MVDVVQAGGKAEPKRWKDLVLGDIVCVKQGCEVPADLLQLSASGDQGGSYIDTCNLDGETNLKLKSSMAATVHADTATKVANLKGTIEYERPNKRLYTFLGKLNSDGQQTLAIDNDVVLLRGAVLRNTKWVYGVVVYAGRQSKLMMNAKQAKLKRSNVERRCVCARA